MSTTAIPMRSRAHADRKGFLAAASALVAVASVGVTLAVTSGDDSPSGPVSAGNAPATAQPNPATAYSNSAAVHAHPLEGTEPGEAAAERYHHFR